MINFQIRPIQKKDNAPLAKMIRQVFVEFDAPTQGTVYSDPTTDDLFALFQVERAIFYVAEAEDGNIIGCCGIYPTSGLPDGCVELVKFYLPANARGKGIGRALMEKSEQYAKDIGCKQIYIESLPDFNKAVSIYEKQGYLRLNQPLGDSGHFGCDIWMLKTIN
jgi:putative acetyltransferase